MDNASTSRVLPAQNPPIALAAAITAAIRGACQAPTENPCHALHLSSCPVSYRTFRFNLCAVMPATNQAKSAQKPKVLLLTNIPAPYREPLHERLAQAAHFDYLVLYCAKKEQNRLWQLPPAAYPQRLLKARQLQFGGRDIYAGSDIRAQLNELKPQVLIVAGFSLPMLQAVWWALRHRVRLVAFSDGTPETERQLSWLHRVLRKLIYPHCQAFIGASQKTLALFKQYGARDDQLFQSCLCVDNARYHSVLPIASRPFDVLLCGQLIPRKMFAFALEVIAGVNQRRQAQQLAPLQVSLVGDGPLRDQLIATASALGITPGQQLQVAGFVQSADLPRYYGQAKVLLFPSALEPWGVVANEACAAGAVVMTTPNTGCAGELVIAGKTGYVMAADVTQWATTLHQLLMTPALLTALSAAAVQQAAHYNYDAATAGVIAALGLDGS